MLDALAWVIVGCAVIGCAATVAYLVITTWREVRFDRAMRRHRGH